MDTQTAYELMRVYLTREGARPAVAVTEAGTFGTCFYETTIDGATHRCAVGCLLPPDAISEIRAAGEICSGLQEALDASPATQREIGAVDHDFLRECQELHDSESSWPDGVFDVALLDELAYGYGLSVVTREVEVGHPVGV